MCSGRVDGRFVMEAFLSGVDGVLVVGCHLGDCHYISGNHEAVKMIRMTKTLLKCAGVDPERLRFEFVSAAEGAKFARVVNDFVRVLKGLGPLGIGGASERTVKLRAAQKSFEKEGLKWILGKIDEFQKTGNLYGERFTENEVDRLIERVASEKIIEHEIVLILEKEGPMSAKDIAERLAAPAHEVLTYIFLMNKKGILSRHGVQGRSPLYTVEADA